MPSSSPRSGSDPRAPPTRCSSADAASAPSGCVPWDNGGRGFGTPAHDRRRRARDRAHVARDSSPASSTNRTSTVDAMSPVPRPSTSRRRRPTGRRRGRGMAPSWSATRSSPKRQLSSSSVHALRNADLKSPRAGRPRRRLEQVGDDAVGLRRHADATARLDEIEDHAGRRVGLAGARSILMGSIVSSRRSARSRGDRGHVGARRRERRAH